MSSHWRSSRWSSAREREEQELARAEEKTQTRRETTPRARKSDSVPEAKPETPAATELSELIAASRGPREKKWPYPEAPKAAEPTPEPKAKPTRSRARKKADPAPSATSGGGPRLPNLPDEPTSTSDGGKSGGPNRPLIFGLLLFVTMGIIAFNPGGIFPSIGGDDDDPTPTEISMIVPTAGSTQPPDTVDPQSTRSSGSVEQVASRPEVVCIDAGHGGWDTGFVREATERAPAMEEADLNLAMSYMLKERLEAEGFTVVLTRPSGTAVNIFNEDVNGDGKVASDVQMGADDTDGNRDELQARINICNAAQADILISVHINGYTDTSARGFEVIYTWERPFGQNSADLAFDVYTSLQTAYTEVGFDIPQREIKRDSEMTGTEMHEGRTEDHYIMTGPAINAADFTITPSEMPGIICEAGFISNDADAAFLADPANQMVIVNAYADGIIQYFDRYPGKFQP